MTSELFKIIKFMGEAFLHIWPYLLVTIPMAVAISMSGVSKHIKRVWTYCCYLYGNSCGGF
jgi:uncharacterized protein